MSRRSRAQDGYSLPEVLMTMVVLAVVIAGALTVIDVVMRQSRGVVERTDAMQRGRLVLDTLTREIRSQVCLNAGTHGLVAASPDSVTFYTDFSDGSSLPELHKLEFDSARKELSRTTWNVTATGPVGYPASPASRTVVADQVIRIVDSEKNPVETVPIFSYFKYNGATPPEPVTQLVGAQLNTPAERILTAKIDIAFESLPSAAVDDSFGTQLKDSVFLRTADPNGTKPDPTCR